jgi:hypothetical protein
MQVVKGSTDITTYFVLRDSTTHAPKTDVTVTDIDLYYVSHKTAISSKADATALDAANSAHTDNAAFNVGQGIYRIDWPDLWTGDVGTTVQLIVVCSGVDTTFLEIEIVGVGQTGDSYAVVNSGTYGNSALKTLIDTTGVVLTAAGIDAIFDRNSSLSISFETLINRIYLLLNNKMNVTDATGVVALRAIGDGSTIATSTLTDNLTTTTRAEVTWS